MKLHKLQIAAFRGATKAFALPFAPDKNITLIYGENGSGKSTIADALICVCTDALGSMEDKSGADKSWLCAAGQSPDTVQLALHTDQGVFSARLAGKKFVHTPDSGRPRLRHLRRSSVVALSTATPSERYEQLAEYFDLSPIVRSEDKLRTLLRNLKSESERLLSAQAEVQRILEEIWRNEGQPTETWQEWAQTESAKDLDAERQKLQRARTLVERAQRLFQSAETLRQVRQEGAEARQQREQAEAHLQSLQNQAGADAELLPLLQAARHLLDQHHDGDNCPLCRQTADHTQLRKALDARLQAMHALQEALAAATAARETHQNLQAVWKRTLEDFNQTLEQLLHSAEADPDCPALLRSQLERILQEPTHAQRLEQLDADLESLSAMMRGRQLIAETIAKALDQHFLIAENWRAVQSKGSAARENAARLQAAEQALQIVENSRKQFIDGELAAISAEVDALYQSLHPDEALGQVRLFLKEKGKNSLELNARFHDETELAPQSVYSESHLDTLALCIFLALAKRYGGSDTLLLLDDVLSACDEAHLDRFMALLQAQSAHFAHIIVCTHYRPWQERFAAQQPVGLELVTLGNWSLERGITQMP